jgi:hypothetical protein
VQVQSIRVEADPAGQGVCAAIALAQTGMEPAARAVLDRFPLSYRLR